MRSSRGVLILALLAGAVVLVLALVLRTPARVVGTGEAVPGAVRDPSAETALSGTTGPERGAIRATLEALPAARPVGTRLSGDGKLDGRVVERESGAGVAGVRVELLPFSPVSATLVERILALLGFGPELPETVRPIASTLSGEDGSFRFRGVRAGSWFVEARGPYHAPEGNLRALVRAKGESPPLDVHVLAGGRVLGRVLAPDGAPARSATVVLMGGPGRFLTDAASGDLRLFETTTDSEGAFVFEGVPPGGGYDVSAAGDSFAVSHVLGIDVAARADARADVQARAGGSIRGRVLSSRDANPSTPLAGAHVAAIPRGFRDLLLVGQVLAATHAVTGSDGTFVLAHVPPGEVDLALVAPGHVPAIEGRTVVADGATISAGDLTVTAGRHVHGRVIDAAGDPITGVRVAWTPFEDARFDPGDFKLAPFLVQAMPGFLFPTTDEDGRFEAGPFLGHAPHELDFRKLGWNDESASVADDRLDVELVVTMSHGGAVEGSVVDARDESPVTCFTVATLSAIGEEPGAPPAWNPFSGGRLFEDPAGRFRFGAVTPGTAKLQVAAPGYAPATVDVEVQEGATAEGVVVRLRRGAKVSGVVVGEDGAPVPGARVVAVPQGDKARGRGNLGSAAFYDATRLPPPLMGFAVGLGLTSEREGVSGARGEFELTSVAPGTLLCRGFHRDFAYGSSDVFTLVAGANLDAIRVEMHPGGGVEGKVRDRNGRPVAGVAVVALAPMAMSGAAGSNSEGALYEGQSDADGRYRIVHMAAGSYFLFATRGDEALHPMSFLGRMNLDMVSVPKGETVRYDLVDSTSGGCRVHGRVLDAGVPVASGTLMATATEGTGALGIDMKMARLSAEGLFEFPGLAPGSWQLVLQGSKEVRMRLDVPDQPELAVDLSLPEGGVEGSVVDAATGEPVPDAEVRLRPLGVPEAKGLLALVVRQGDVHEEWTDEHGAFAFEWLCAGEYELTVEVRRGEKGAKRFAPSDPVLLRVDEGRIERDRVVRLSTPLSMPGFVRGEDGEPIAGADVSARRQDRSGARAERTSTDASGAFELEGLAPGVYAVEASAKDHAPDAVRDVRLEGAGNGSKPVEIRLRRGVAVSVRVYQSDGRAASGARAVLSRVGARSDLDPAEADRLLEEIFKGQGMSDADGRIDLGRFVPGDYRLDVTRGTSVLEVPRVSIRGDRPEVEIRADLP